jgi:acetyl-CoA C-acetyltransferase
MADVYIIEACRSAIGKRGKGVAGLTPAALLGAVQVAALERGGIAAEHIDQVFGGCVSQLGEQTFKYCQGGLAVARPSH